MQGILFRGARAAFMISLVGFASVGCAVSSDEGSANESTALSARMSSLDEAKNPAIVGAGSFYVCGPQGARCCAASGDARCEGGTVVCLSGTRVVQPGYGSPDSYLCLSGEAAGSGSDYVCGPQGGRCCEASGDASCLGGFHCLEGEPLVVSDSGSCRVYVCVI